MSTQTNKLAGSSKELRPECDERWMLAVSTARGRMPGGWVPVDADLVIALHARIAGAPVAIMDTRDALGLCAPTEAGFSALHALQGRRVALLDIG